MTSERDTADTDESSRTTAARVIDSEELLIPDDIAVDADFAQSLDELSPDELLTAADIIQEYATEKWDDGWDRATIGVLDNLASALQATARRRVESYPSLSPTHIKLGDRDYADLELVTYSGSVADRRVHVSYVREEVVTEAGDTVSEDPVTQPEDIKLGDDKQVVTADAELPDGQEVTVRYRFASVIDPNTDEILVEEARS